MIKQINRDDNFLSLKSIEATKDDINIGQDLLDTLEEHRNSCVGMAANMIGVNKRIIIINDKEKLVVMYNPRILKTFGEPYITKEGCLSHTGQREVKRYKKIQVEYYTKEFKRMEKTYTNFEAQIIQHEIDHLEGILI